MHINIIAFEFAPLIERSPLSQDVVLLARALTMAEHTVSVVMPFNVNIDVNDHALARRLMPVKVSIGQETLSCYRYDGRTSDGVNVYLLDIDGAIEIPGEFPPETLFFMAACHIISSFSDRVAGCIAVGTEAAGFSSVLNQNEAVGHIPVISVLSHLSAKTEERVVRDLESSDRIVLSHGRLYAGTLTERLSPLKEMLSKGHIQWMSKPGVVPKTPLDKLSAKAAFQVAAGLPVRADIPVVLFAEGLEPTIADFLSRNVQVVAPASLAGGEALAERYPDRLVLKPEAAFDQVLGAADGVVVGNQRALMAGALAHGAIPIVTAELSDEAVDLDATLASGSTIVIADLSFDALNAGLERLMGAFHMGADFKRLLTRLPGFASTWEKAADQFQELIKEIASEKKRDGQTE